MHWPNNQLTVTGYSPRHAIVREMAEQIRQQRVTSINDQFEQVYYPPLGKNWVTQFIKRHLKLKTVIRKSIEASRL